MSQNDEERLLGRVRELAELPDQDSAERVAAAVLAEVAACLTWGEAENLADLLPTRLAAEVRAATSMIQGTARFNPDRFISNVAQRESVDQSQAKTHVRMVVLALQEWLPAERFGHLTDELPWLTSA